MWGGDTAIATIQYSYLPSWISFLVDQDRATDAGRALFEAVYAKWSTLPVDTRPKLITYGLSLGSFAAQAPFSGVQDLAARTDGALFMGTPNFAQPWRTITDDRDPGSPEWQPVYQQGATARFASTQGDLARPGGQWPDAARGLHAARLGPGRLVEPGPHEPAARLAGRAPRTRRLTTTRWVPIITFLQVTVDQFFGVDMPPGHGHNYEDTVVYAWENVVPPPAWTPEDSATLQAYLNGPPAQ